VVGEDIHHKLLPVLEILHQLLHHKEIPVVLDLLVHMAVVAVLVDLASQVLPGLAMVA
jgi:hypothetical protein